MRQMFIKSSSITHFMYFLRVIFDAHGSFCELNIEGVIERGKAFLGHHFWSSMTSDITECAVTCIRRKRCVAFNYDMDRRLCELTEGKVFPTQVSSKMKVFSRISAWPSQVDPDCYDRPCNDSEVCIPGGLGDRGMCSFICMAMPVRCPLLNGIKSNSPRTVGSTLTFTCDVGYRGGSSAICLSSLQWDKPLDTTCTPVYQSYCKTTEECSDINGECVASKCVCQAGFVYEPSETKCLIDCRDWTRFENSCYKFEHVSMSFDKAEDFCSENDAHLVQVDTKAEGEFIKEKLRETGTRASYWNDVYQFEQENGSEKWKTSGDELKDEVEDWGYTEPNGNNEKCTVFYRHKDFTWADIQCNKAFRPLCEKELSLT